jgi:hypothetical protein
MTTTNDRDADRLELLDRIAERLPDLDLDQHEVEWDEFPDGGQALVLNAGEIAFGLHADDVHAIGSLAPLIPGHIGCIVIRPDGSRYVARAVPDPLAQQR